MATQVTYGLCSFYGFCQSIQIDLHRVFIFCLPSLKDISIALIPAPNVAHLDSLKHIVQEENRVPGGGSPFGPDSTWEEVSLKS